MSQSALAFAPTLAVVDGVPTTTSKQIAEHFGKRHERVLDAIRTLHANLPEEHKHDFVFMLDETKIGNGATRQDPAYRLTRDGFTLLAMGFTSAKALAFKLAYLKAFNAMEAALQAQATAVATQVQCLDDMDLMQVEAVIKHLRARHDLSVKMLRDAVLTRFGAPSFAHIPRSRFQEVLAVLREYAPAPQPQGTQVCVPSPSGDSLITITFTPKAAA